jgi:hypothetical protein
MESILMLILIGVEFALKGMIEPSLMIPSKGGTKTHGSSPQCTVGARAFVPNQQSQPLRARSRTDHLQLSCEHAEQKLRCLFYFEIWFFLAWLIMI